MELPSPVPDEAPQQPPQDADAEGSSQDYAILCGVDAAGLDMAELCARPRLTKYPGLFWPLTWSGF